MHIKNSVFLITGGASGLGEATARMAVENGGKVVHRRPAGGSRRQARQGTGRRASSKCDVTSEADGKAAVELAVKEFGGVHVLVNCAGIGIAEHTLGKDGPHNLAHFTRVVTINLIGTFNMIRLAADAMAKGRPECRRRARRDHQYRLGGGVRRPDRPGGLFGLQGRHRRHDAADRARPVAQRHPRHAPSRPGIFETPMLLGLPKDVQDALGKMVPFPPRLGRPAEYAQLARAHHRERDAERRDHPARRRHPHGAEVESAGYLAPTARRAAASPQLAA